MSMTRFLRAAAVAGLAALLAFLPIGESFARNPRGQVSPLGSPGLTQQYKFIPGDYVESQTLYNTSVAQAITDLQLAITSGTSGFAGYIAGFQWGDLETSAGSSLSPTYNFAKIWQIFNYEQAVWPGAAYAIYLTGLRLSSPLTQSQMTAANMSNPAGYFVPAYILNSGGSVAIPNCFGCAGSTNYTIAPIYAGASSYGLVFGAFNSGAQGFAEVNPAWQNPGVVQAWTNFLQALSQSVDPAPAAYSGATTYSAGIQVTSGGNTYTYINAANTAGNAPPNATFWALTNQTYVGMTLDQIPLVPYIATNDEVSYNFCSGSACNYSTGVVVNPPQTAGGVVPVSNTQFWTLRVQWLNQVVSFFPNTPFGLCDSFTWDVAGAGSDTAANMAANINQNISAGNRSAPVALSSIPGLVFSTSDTYGFDWSSTNAKAAYGKQGYYGIPSPVIGSALPTPTVASQIGIMGFAAQVQPNDYFFNVSGAGDNASAVQQVMQASVVPHSQWRFWTLTDKTGGSTPWTSYIHGAIVANQASFPTSTLRPTRLMNGITINAVTVASTTSLTITWTPPSLNAAETGLTETLYRNGVVCPSCTGLISGTFTDTGLIHGTSYTYTMAMANTNGTGPQGAGVSATP